MELICSMSMMWVLCGACVECQVSAPGSATALTGFEPCRP